ncbi:sulfatase-like hydrolase/transferase [Variovorax sp. J2P1-59]|uniref:phosphoethanolamine transferase n=1 Tax=Variovorax flavidus TaxID=3053501 RepID=UPI002576D025|nr:sulfatase-like hydrolase/transferase [Variovorax sp. J2P1-59]MDM0073433.1 sulfatase-like hydrolase/transferase [Variovorax sp. J2P1-59]
MEPEPPPQGLLALVQAANRWASRPRSPLRIVIWLSVYLVLAANWPLWSELARIGGAPSVYLPTIASVGLLMTCGTVALLSLTAWSRWMKPLWLGVVLLAAVVQYYMLSYRVVIDPTMLANALQSDASDVRDLLSWRLILSVLLVSALPGWFLWHVRTARIRLLSQAWRNVTLLLAAAAAAAGGAMVMNRQLAPLMRNNAHLRYMMNPLATLYSASAVVIRPIFGHRRRFIALNGAVALGPSYATQERPPLLVLVVGKGARADHFGLNGYARDTTPALAARKALSYRDVRSCGTSTLGSVPCMFSGLGKQAFEASSDDHDNLLDVLQAAGLAVFWIGNQTGTCKGVCDRIPHVSAFDRLDSATRRARCDGDECLDDVMLDGLDARIAGLPAERRAKGVVLVMHQIGSHGPDYYKRSSPDAKRFMPECRTNVLGQCSHSELMNGYDNSIAYTDRFLGQLIDWLQLKSKQFDTALLYIGDHGESLGEYGLFLHGVPYGFAPEVQKQVPMVTWFNDGMLLRARLSPSCMESGLDAPLTHDNFFHTVLGLMDVQTASYNAGLDPLSNCREPRRPG